MPALRAIGTVREIGIRKLESAADRGEGRPFAFRFALAQAEIDFGINIVTVVQTNELDLATVFLYDRSNPASFEAGGAVSECPKNQVPVGAVIELEPLSDIDVIQTISESGRTT
jgi:hypothetical protein